MKYEEFLENVKQVEKLPIEEQKEFYENKIATQTGKTTIKAAASYRLAKLLNMTGDYQKALAVLSPISLDYLSYPFSSEIISCVNLTGVSNFGMLEYGLARYFFKLALRLTEQSDDLKQNDALFHVFTYSNLALCDTEDKDYLSAIENVDKALKYLDDSNSFMAAYVHLNKSIIYQKMNELEKSKVEIDIAENKYHASQIMKKDYMSVLAYWACLTNNDDQYEDAKKELIPIIDKLEAQDLIDICKQLFPCALKEKDVILMNLIIDSMKQCIDKHPEELKIQILLADFRYQKACQENNIEQIIIALEEKDVCNKKLLNRKEEIQLDTLNRYQIVNKELLSANVVKSQFLANMSHDIRTPMNAIIGLSKLMEYDINNKQKMELYLNKLQSSSQHMLSLINDVLDMSKIESKQVKLNSESIDLKEQIEIIDSIIRPWVDNKEHDYVTNYHNLKYNNLIGDAPRLRQIIINLLSNAIKYTNPGGHIKMDITEFDTFLKDQINLEIKVSDDGCGMSKEFIKHIYEPFARAQNHLTNKVQGTGLGMAISKEIVDLMGGSIKIDSKENQGTCFTVLLPLNIDFRHKEADLIKKTETYDISGMKFLCAEDNELNGEILETLLQANGADCTIYQNGEELCNAYFHMKENEYCAILMDIQMPILDGLAATRKIREFEKSMNIRMPIIAMTANAFAEDRQNALNSGMDDYITKPINIELLKQIICKNVK